MPGEVTDAVDALPRLLLQLYDIPPLAVSEIDVVVQVNSVVEELIAATGAAMFCVIVMLSESVHPLAAVTVTV